MTPVEMIITLVGVILLTLSIILYLINNTEKIIKKSYSKCNFYSDEYCNLKNDTNTDCDYDDCIFMKMLEKEK